VSVQGSNSTGRISTVGTGVNTANSTWQWFLWCKLPSYGASRFLQILSRNGGGQGYGVNTGEVDTSNPYETLDAFAGAATPQSILTGSDTRWIFLAGDHTAGTALYRFRWRFEGSATWNTFTLNTTTELTISGGAVSLFGSGFGDPVNCYLRSFAYQDAVLSDADLLTNSQSLTLPAIGNSLTFLALNDATSGTTLGDNLGTGADWTVNTSGLSTQAGVEPDTSLPLKFIPPSVDDWSHSAARSRSSIVTRAIQAAGLGQVLTSMGSMSPEIPHQPTAMPPRYAPIGREPSSVVPLLTITPSAGVQFYGDATQRHLRSLRVDRDAGNGIAPPSIGILAPGNSWYQQEQRPATRALPRPELPSVPIIPQVSAATLTWFAHSPTRIKTSFGTDAGADAISPLNPPNGSWYPDAPDRPVPRRYLRDEPGSGLVRTLTTATVVFVAPDAAWAQRRRVPSQDGSGFGERPLFLGDTAWARQEDRPATRRILFEDRSALAGSGAGASDLSWLVTPPGTTRRAQPVHFEAVTLLPLFQPQAPGWMPQGGERRAPARPVSWEAAFLVQPIPVAAASDLSWAEAYPARALPRPIAFQVPPAYPAAFVAPTLSAWGWIPEVPSRPGLRVVSNAFVSALVPPAIITALAQGWIPSLPDQGKRTRATTHQDQSQIPPLSMQALGWLGESPGPRLSRARAAGAAELPPPFAVVPYGWFPAQDDAARARRAREGFAVLAGSPATLAPLLWTEDATRISPRRAPLHADPGEPGAPAAALPAYWQHWQVGPRPPGPVVTGAHETPLLVLVPASLPPMPTWDLSESFVVVNSRVALQAALLAGEATIVLGQAMSQAEWSAVLQELGEWRAILRS
jgi:hypothetical protein